MSTGRIEPYNSIFSGPKIDELLLKVANMGDIENGWTKLKSEATTPYMLGDLTAPGNYQVMYYTDGPEGVNISPANIIIMNAQLDGDTSPQLYQFFYLGIPTFVYYRKYNTSTNKYGDWILDRNTKIISKSAAPEYYLVENKTLWLDTHSGDSPILKVYVGLDENNNPIWEEIVPLGAMKKEIYDRNNELENVIVTEINAAQAEHREPKYDSVYKYINYIIDQKTTTEDGSIVDLFNDHIKDILTEHIGGYYYNNKFYSDAEHTQQMTPSTDKVYVDVSTGKTYRYTNSTYNQIHEYHILDLVDEDPEKTSTVLTERDKWNAKFSQQDVYDEIFDTTNDGSVVKIIEDYVDTKSGGDAASLQDKIDEVLEILYGSSTTPLPPGAKGLIEYFAEHNQLPHPTEEDINKLKERLKFIPNNSNTYKIFTLIKRPAAGDNTPSIEDVLNSTTTISTTNYHDGDVVYFKYGSGTSATDFEYVFYQIEDMTKSGVNRFIPINLANNIGIRWENIQNKPATLAGYGINDGVNIGKYNTDLNNLKNTINDVCDISLNNLVKIKSNYDVLFENTITVLDGIKNMNTGGDSTLDTIKTRAEAAYNAIFNYLNN